METIIQLKRKLAELKAARREHDRLRTVHSALITAEIIDAKTKADLRR